MYNLEGVEHKGSKILGYSHSDNGRYYFVLCKCGKKFTISVSKIRSLIKNDKPFYCGCMRGKKGTHHFTNHRLYPRYRQMVRRCTDTKCNSYPNYGGRGIKVCDRWLESFENFLEDMEGSFKEGLTLERLDVDGDYNSENCVWDTIASQSINKRVHKSLTGVYKVSGYDNMWKVSISYNNEKQYFGCYEDFFEACCISFSVKNRLKSKDNVNIKPRLRTPKSKVKYIHWAVDKKAWRVYIKECNILKYVGTFKELEIAKLKQKEAYGFQGKTYEY